MPRVLPLVLAAAILAAGWMMGAAPAGAAPPPTFIVSAGSIPSPAAARAMLTDIRARTAARSRQRRDLDWLAKLDRRAHGKRVPAGRVATIDLTMRMNAWWLSRKGRWPGARVILRLPSGILVNYRPGHGFIVNPVATTGRWQHLNDDVSAAGLARALAPLAVAYDYQGDRWLGFEYFDVNGRLREVLPGISAMAQARVASTFAQAFRETGNVRFARVASQVLRSFTVPVADHGGLAQLTSPDGSVSGEWFPERVYPGKDPWLGAALNGFMATILDLDATRVHLRLGLEAHSLSVTDRREVQRDLGQLRELVGAALESLEAFLPLHDTGSWSIYGMRTGGRPWGTVLADLNYHCYHIKLLTGLEQRHPGRGFGPVAERWRGYVEARGLVCPPRGR